VSDSGVFIEIVSKCELIYTSESDTFIFPEILFVKNKIKKTASLS